MLKPAMTTGILIALASLTAVGGETERVYKWVDEEGQVHYGDSIPPEYSDLPKQVLNEHAVTVDHLEGRKTAEQLAAEQKARDLAMQKELQLRADKALLATYLTVEEIVMHRDRRIELFQAQSRVTRMTLDMFFTPRMICARCVRSRTSIRNASTEQSSCRPRTSTCSIRCHVLRSNLS